MIKIKIIAPGRLKEKYLRDALEEYIKRLSSYAKTEIIELDPVRLPDKPTRPQIEKALLDEAEMIKKRITKDSFITALCIEGREFTSEEFAEQIEQNIDKGIGNITFIIGSSYGLHPSIKDIADMKLSFSRMVFPHQLFRVMLLEQIYRSFKIIQGSDYHK